MATITNRCKNPSFEAALVVATTNGVLQNGTATVAQQGGDANATGSNCASIASSTSGNGGQLIMDDTVVGASVLAFDYWLASGGSDWTFALNDGSFTSLVGSTVLTPTAAKQRVVIPFTTAVNPTYIRCYLNRASATAGELRIDAVYLGPAGIPYFDGSTVDSGGYLYDWTGTANQSTSTRTTDPRSRRIRSQFELRPY